MAEHWPKSAPGLLRIARGERHPRRERADDCVRAETRATATLGKRSLLSSGGRADQPEIRSGVRCDPNPLSRGVAGWAALRGWRTSIQRPPQSCVAFGAERVIVVSLRPDQSPSARADVAERARVLDQARIAPTAPFLFGKTLNALLLDRTNQDYSQLKRINDLLEAGTRAYGREFSRV